MRKVILIPGSFKPFHDGHLSMIESYLKSDFKPDLIRFLISKKDRDGISAPVTLKFMKKVLKKFKGVVEVEVCDLPSPITECYDIIIHSSDTTYTIGGSDKDDDDRIKVIIDAFSKSKGKYHDLVTNNNVKVVKSVIKVESLKYKRRGDEYKGKDVSASVCRKDIINDDFEKFKTAYINMIKNGYVTEDDVRTYFNQCKKKCHSLSKDTIDKI